jgi:ankyrin repeat protein
MSIAKSNSPLNNFVEEEGETLCAFVQTLIQPFDIPYLTLMDAIDVKLRIYNTSDDINLFVRLINLFHYLDLDKEPLYQCVRELLNKLVLTMFTNPDIKIPECITDKPYNDNMGEEMKQYCLPTIFGIRRFDFLTFRGNNFIVKDEKFKRIIAHQITYLDVMLKKGYIWNRDFSLIIAEEGNLEALQWLDSNEYPLSTHIPSHAARYGHLHILQWLNEYNDWDSYVTVKATIGGHLDCLKYAQERGCPIDEEVACDAARHGHLHILKYLNENGYTWKNETVTAQSLKHGHIDCLKYMIENGVEWPEYNVSIKNIKCLIYAHENGCPLNEWGTDVMNDIANMGDIECMKYAHKIGCPWDEWTINNAATRGYLNIVKYAHENGCNFGMFTTKYAAHSGNLELLKYVHEHGAKLIPETWEGATKGNNIDIMKYLHENKCPCYPEIMRQAIKYNDLQCVKYLHETVLIRINDACVHDDYNECDTSWYHSTTFERFIKNGDIEMLKYIHINGAEYEECMLRCITRRGQLDMLKYIHEEWGIELPSKLYTIAVENEHFDCFEYLYDHGCPYNNYNKIYIVAMPLGDLDFIIHLRHMGFPYKDDDIKYAAQFGHLNIVKYFHEQYDNELTYDVFSAAAESGNMELVEYLHKNNCPWSKKTFDYACMHGHTKIVAYLYDNGCPFSDLCSMLAASNGYLDILMYLHHSKYPFDYTAYEAAAAGGHRACYNYVTEHILEANESYEEINEDDDITYYLGTEGGVEY